MRRGELVSDIQRLERLLSTGDLERRRAEAEEAAGHLDTQIARLETAALKVERRMLRMDGERDLSASERLLFEGEKAELDKRLRALRDKIATLQAERPELPMSNAAARPQGATAELRRKLRVLVGQLHADPHVPRRDIAPFQSRLAELVRERRDALRQVAARLTDARTYLVRTAKAIDAQKATADLLATGDGEGGLPLRDERTDIATRLEMARVAVRDAHTQMFAVANDWPELEPLARQPDWTNLPFNSIRRLLLPPEERRGESIPDPVSWVQRALSEAHQTTRATALWVDELRGSIERAPAPE